ncbi:MAG: hypothetical protein HOY75_09085 [Streptomyces sp.]|nr:hypothetical protein [Streptomyces sp.]
MAWTDAPTDLSGKDDQNRSVLTVLAASDAVWRKAEVEAPQPPVPNAPRPIPRPYPRSGPPGPAAPTAAPPTTATTTRPTALGPAVPSGLGAASSATPPGEKPEATTAPVAPLVLSPDPASFPDFGMPSAPGEPEAPEESVPAEASPASPWDMARIRFTEEALDYEQRLATYLAADERINAELAKVVQAFWVLALHNGADYRKFGSDSPAEVGAAGTSFESLSRVVESGNVRERVDFLFSGAKNGLIPDLTGGKVHRHPVIKAERDDRRNTEAYTRYKEKQAELRAAGLDEEDIAEETEDLVAMVLTRLRPEDVWPPLSQDEWLLGVRDGKLRWRPAGLAEELPMSAGLQARSQESGGLVLTGTSGSAYFILVCVARMSGLTGLPVDLGLIRAGLVSFMTAADHHSFHEVMAGAQLLLDEVAHPEVPDYADGWYRYRNVYPLTEEELRAHVARDGVFPDEHALALFAELDDGAEEGSESDEGDDSSDR